MLMGRFGLTIIFAVMSFALSHSFLAAKTLQGQKEPLKVAWQKIYGGKNDDRAVDVVALENGESAIVGTCKSYGAKRKDICVLRMDKNGDMKWRLLIGGKKEDEGKAIARSADGQLFVLGRSKSFSKEYDYDLYLSKVSLEGKLLWSVSIGGTRDEYPADVAGTDDGGALVVGASDSFRNGYKDIYIVKVDKNAKIKKQRIYGGERADEARALTRLRDGNFAVAGYRETDRAGDSDFFVMKVDQEGKKIWFKSFGDKYEDRLEGISATAEGGIYAVGTTSSYGSEQTDLVVMRLSPKGQIEWFKLYGYKYYEYGNDIVTLRDGNALVVGGTNTLGKGDHSPYFLLLSPEGALRWSKVYGGEDTDRINALTELTDGSVIGVGETESFARSKMFYLLRLQSR